MTIAAIPTVFNGVQYRSRLEATWAAFFTDLDWPFEYEPFDLDGWIPDFVLRGDTTVLVEVKPIVEFCDVTAAEMSVPDPTWELLLVGVGPRVLDGYCDQGALGWLTEFYGDAVSADGTEYDRWWDDACFGRWHGTESEKKNPRGLFGFCHATGSYRDRITGCYDGGSTGGDVDVLMAAWAKAKNAVQWKAPKMRVVR